MKKFEFSLDKVLKLKRQQERLAEMEMMRARKAVMAAQDHVLALKEQLTRISESLSSRLGQAIIPQQWVSSYEISERIGQSILQAELEVQKAESALISASQERAHFATEAEALSTLRQQQFDKWRHEMAASDQQRLDELGLRRWQAAQAAQTIRSGAA